MRFSNMKRHALGAVVVCSLAAGGFLLARNGAVAEESPAPGSSSAGQDSRQEKGAGVHESSAVPGGGSVPTGPRSTGEGQPAVRVSDLAAQTQANQRSVVEAVQTGRFPERLNPLVPARPFDRAEFERDPQAYLDVVEPGRVFQTAEGSKGVKTLDAEGAAYKEVDPEESVVLAVKGEAGAPVTFTSFDKGAFENKLATITVLAGADGVARVVFTATAGTVESVHILAASPMTVGEVRFLVEVNRG